MDGLNKYGHEQGRRKGKKGKGRRGKDREMQEK